MDSKLQESEQYVNSERQEFEQYLKNLLNETPSPKFSLWQPVHCLSLWSGRVENGRIVGFYFLSVGVGYQNADGLDPGWYYYIENELAHSIKHEGAIESGLLKDEPEDEEG